MRTGCCGSRHNGAPPVATTISCPSSLALGFGCLLLPALLCVNAALAAAQSAERGTIVDPVVCASDASQTYALYLPSAYSADRKWSLLLAFHPAARGRQMVGNLSGRRRTLRLHRRRLEQLQERPVRGIRRRRSRHGQRRRTALRHRCATSLSRPGFRAAPGSPRHRARQHDIAGVIASSAGFPDSLPRDSGEVSVFRDGRHRGLQLHRDAPAGSQAVSPHFLAVFHGATRFRPATWRSKPSSGWSFRRCGPDDGPATRRSSRHCSRSGVRRSRPPAT